MFFFFSRTRNGKEYRLDELTHTLSLIFPKGNSSRFGASSEETRDKPINAFDSPILSRALEPPLCRVDRAGT